MANAPQSLFLRGIISLASPQGNAVHLTATRPITDLSRYTIWVDGAWLGATLSGIADAGDDIIVVWGASSPLLFPAPGHLCASRFRTSIADSWHRLSFTGGEAVGLVENNGTHSALIDAFGYSQVNGTGTAWDYTRSWAYRTTLKPAAEPGIFDASDWTFGGAGCAASVDIGDVTTWNTTCPYPLCTEVRIGVLLPMFSTEAAGLEGFWSSPRAGVIQARPKPPKLKSSLTVMPSDQA